MWRRRTRTDPTVWCLSSEGLGTTYVLVAARVDYFIITGSPGVKFEQLKNALRERFCWGSWKVQSIGLCGVRVHKNVGHTIVLDQTSFVNSGIIPISVETHRDLDRPLTGGEITNLRGVWGSNAMESDTDWTTACGSVERDAIEDFTTNA